MARLEARELRADLAKDRSIQASLALDAGAALQVAGPSGAGKTTLLRLLARLETRDGGELLLDGEPAERIKPTRWRRRVVYLAQQPAMLEGTVLDNLAAGFLPAEGGGIFPDAKRDQACRLLSALGLDSNGELLEQTATTLSGGEAARVALCRALLIEPAVLLADEPTANLDSDSAALLVEVVRRWLGDGGALVLVAHDEEPWRELERDRLELSL
jgi:putative ABC transport system ATP-binding protein